MSENKNENKNETNENSAKRLEGVSMGISHFGAPVEDVGNYKSTWTRLIAHCRKFMPLIITALIFTIGGNILQVISPGYIRRMIDTVQTGIKGSIDMQALWVLALELAVLYAVAALLGYLQSFIMAAVTARISKNLRSDILRKFNRLPLRFFDNISIGDIMSRVTNDVDTIGQTLNQNIGMLFSSVTLFVGSLIIMLWTNWILAIIAIAASSIGFVSSKVVMTMSQKYFKQQQRGLGAINGHIEEIYSAHDVVATYNGEESAAATFSAMNAELYGAIWKAQFVSGFITPLMNFSGSIAYVAICVAGAIMASRGNITFGVIVAFMLYTNQFTQALTHIAETVPGLQSTTASSERVFDILREQELEDESDKTASLTYVSGSVNFENIRFGYDPSKPVIHDFSAKVQAGQKIAIVGPTGAGKTTLVNLLMRFYELDGGSIQLDGTATEKTTRNNVHEQFCMVLQDTWLFEGTIRDNIVYNKSGVSDDRVAEVCGAVGLHRYISTLPGGYDTVLDSRSSLSEGQKQLVTIARAMIHDAPMLILDEATSSVDTRTEVLIQTAMDKLMTGRTSFVIAHRLSTIRNADMILVLKDGDIIERGTHDELLDQKGFYSQLYRSQFERVSEA